MAIVAMYIIYMGPTTGYLIWRTAMKWRTAVDRALAPLGLTHAQFSVLGSLSGLSRQGRQPSQRELADVTGLEPIYVSKLVRALEKAGIVRRPVDPRDPRAVRLHLTEHGHQVAAEAIERVHATHRKLTEPIGGPDGERDRWLRKTLHALLAETPLVAEPTKGTEMTTPVALNGRDINLAAMASKSLLDRILDKAGISFLQWAALRATAVHTPASRAAITQETAAPGINADDVLHALDEIESAGLVDRDGERWTLTAQGSELFQQISEQTARVANRLYEGIPEEDLAATKRVLDQVKQRASDLSAGL